MYHIKWTQLANLPAPIYYAYAAVQGNYKVFIAGGISPVDNAKRQVYVFDVNTNHWSQLPPLGHYYGIPHVIGGKLTIIGGRLSATKEITNKVSTFDESSQTWTSYYPDLLLGRSKPGVVTHLEHVVVAGGLGTSYTLDDIEILNWKEYSHWKKVPIKLPFPLYSFTPIISSDHYVIVGYGGSYKIPVSDIIRSGDHQPQILDKFTYWTKMMKVRKGATLIPSSSPPVVVGGFDQSSVSSDIKMYDEISKSWRNIASLPSARAYPAVAAINNNAIIVFGGCTKTGGVSNCRSSSLAKVELGQIELAQ